MDPTEKRARFVELAAADNARLTELFAAFYNGKKKRTARPTREEIIRERWATYSPDGKVFPMTDAEWKQVVNVMDLAKDKRTPPRP